MDNTFPAFFEYRGQKIKSFSEFQQMKAAERRDGTAKPYKLKRKLPKFMTDTATKRDYAEYIERGGAESPEEMRSIMNGKVETR